MDEKKEVEVKVASAAMVAVAVIVIKLVVQCTEWPTNLLQATDQQFTTQYNTANHSQCFIDYQHQNISLL
jgi:hypothetical protein